MEKKNLHLFDVSQYISSGNDKYVLFDGIRNTNGPFMAAEMPCGGLTYLCNSFYEYGSEENQLVYCIDKTPTIKREMFTHFFPDRGGYKGHRPKKKDHIVYQRRMAEEMLELIGYSVVAVDGYEADDCIASIVKYYKDSYEHVYIHSKDSDLFYLVCDNVEIVPLAEPYFYKDSGGRVKHVVNGKHINMYNWETEVLKDRWVPYDTLTITKMCMGEMGDNIPHINEHMERVICDNLPKDCYVKCGDNEYLREYIASVTGGDRLTLAVFDLIAPLIADHDKVELYDECVDNKLRDFFASKLQCKYMKDKQVEEIKTDLISRYVDEYMRR